MLAQGTGCVPETAMDHACNPSFIIQKSVKAKGDTFASTLTDVQRFGIFDSNFRKMCALCLIEETFGTMPTI